MNEYIIAILSKQKPCPARTLKEERILNKYFDHISVGTTMDESLIRFNLSKKEQSKQKYEGWENAYYGAVESELSNKKRSELKKKIMHATHRLKIKM